MLPCWISVRVLSMGLDWQEAWKFPSESSPLNEQFQRFQSIMPGKAWQSTSCDQEACLSFPIFLRDFPAMVLNQSLLANSGLTAILALRSSCFLPVGWDQAWDLFSDRRVEVSFCCKSGSDLDNLENEICGLILLLGTFVTSCLHHGAGPWTKKPVITLGLVRWLHWILQPLRGGSSPKAMSLRPSWQWSGHVRLLFVQFVWDWGAAMLSSYFLSLHLDLVSFGIIDIEGKCRLKSMTYPLR
jgi:hypothetical protein